MERSILLEKFLRCWECLHFCYCKNYLKIFIRSEFNEKIFFVYIILRFWCKTYLEGKFQDKLKKKNLVEVVILPELSINKRVLATMIIPVAELPCNQDYVCDITQKLFSMQVTCSLFWINQHTALGKPQIITAYIHQCI